jgi:rhodanese-related sulfurtransferase
MDFMNFSSIKLKAPRRPACIAPACALIRDLPREDADLELRLPSLAAAAHEGYQLIDLRTAEEVAAWPIAAQPVAAQPMAAQPMAAQSIAAQPGPARHIPMATLLAHPELLAPGASYLLLCASGKRSLAAARELRKRGLAVRSLAGGLQGLAPHGQTGS